MELNTLYPFSQCDPCLACYVTEPVAVCVTLPVYCVHDLMLAADVIMRFS